MARHTLKILRCEHRKIFKVCLAIFQHYEIKGLRPLKKPLTSSLILAMQKFVTMFYKESAHKNYF